MPPCKNYQRTQDSQRAVQSILWQVQPMAYLPTKVAWTDLLPLPQIKMGTQKPSKSELALSISRNCLHQQALHWTKNVYPLTVKAGKTATLKVSDTPKATTTLIELFKIDMDTSKSVPQGNASLEGAEFTWNFYAGYYNKDNLPKQPTRTWITKTVAEKGSDGNIHYITKRTDSFYTQNGVPCLPLGTLTVSENKSPTGYLLDGAFLLVDGSEEQIKGMYLTQITKDRELAVLKGSNQYSVSEKVIRGGVKSRKEIMKQRILNHRAVQP